MLQEAKPRTIKQDLIQSSETKSTSADVTWSRVQMIQLHFFRCLQADLLPDFKITKQVGNHIAVGFSQACFKSSVENPKVILFVVVSFKIMTTCKNQSSGQCNSEFKSRI